MRARRLTLAALAAVLCAAPAAHAKDESCTFGVNCRCDTVRQFDANVVFCEDFENPSLNDGDTRVFNDSLVQKYGVDASWGKGWSTKYPGGPTQSSCENQVLQPEKSRNGGPGLYPNQARGSEGTHSWSCENVVQEGACDVAGQSDCVFQGTSSLGHRYVPGREAAGGWDAGAATFSSPAKPNFNVTMAVKLSKNWQRCDYLDGNCYPRKTDEFNASGGGYSGAICPLGCAGQTIPNMGADTFGPFNASLFMGGSPGSISQVVGQAQLVGTRLAWGPSAGKYSFDVDHGLDKWRCWRLSINGLGQQGGRIRHWIDEKLAVDAQNLDLRTSSAQVDGIFWNFYYNAPGDRNGIYQGPSTAYRYEDNVVVTKGTDPVSCEAIGFNFGATGQQPLGTPGQPKLIP